MPSKQLAFSVPLYAECSSPPWLYAALHVSHNRSNGSYPPFSSATLRTIKAVWIYFLKCLSSNTIQSYAPNVACHSLFLKCNSKFHV
jgi:hypothetical protein